MKNRNNYCLKWKQFKLFKIIKTLKFAKTKKKRKTIENLTAKHLKVGNERTLVFI